MLAREAVDEVIDQGRQVLEPLAQRRRVDRDHVEAVVEVLAEAPGLDLLGQVAIGGRHHAHVDVDGGGGAHRLDLAVLQHPQHLGLGARRHVADLVEEHGAAVGGDELADLLAHRAGEAALLVAEQLGLDQLLGDGRAVDLDQRVRVPLTGAMDGARHQLLAGAALAGDEHGGGGRRRALDRAPQLAASPRSRR